MRPPSQLPEDAFDRSAARYDRMVNLNPGYHAHLRSAATELVRRLGKPGPLRVMDLACGSGASTRALIEAVPAGSVLFGLDSSAGMLSQAQCKSWPEGVRFGQAVVGDLSVASLEPGTWDGVLACYLFRNIPETHRDCAVEEVFTLLRPGGWLVVQEYSTAGRRFASLIWDVTCWGIIIPLGIIVDHNPGLYRYLWRSVHQFDSTQRFAARLAAAGFVDIATRTVPGWQRGILHTFVARKPEEP